MLSKLFQSFHHIGVACHDLDREAESWLRIGYKVSGPDFIDPVQKIKGRFIVGAGPRLELLEPLASDSPITNILRKGIKFYHQAFLVPDLDHAVNEMKVNGFKMIAPPVKSVAFKGKRIVFFVMKNMNMIELIENN